MYRRPASCAERRRYRITLEAAIGQGEHFFPSDNRRLARLIWLWHTLHHCCRSYWVGYAGLGVSRGVTHTYTQRLHTVRQPGHRQVCWRQQYEDESGGDDDDSDERYRHIQREAWRPQAASHRETNAAAAAAIAVAVAALGVTTIVE